MTDELDKKIASADCALKEAESNFGMNHVVVADELMKLAALLRQKNRLLDAVNAEARAQVILGEYPDVASHRLDKNGKRPEVALAISSKSVESDFVKSSKLWAGKARNEFTRFMGGSQAHYLWKVPLAIVLGIFLMPMLPAIALIGVCFWPTVVAAGKRKRNASAIFVLNLLLGWTIIGWIIALIWATANDTNTPSMPVAAKKGELKACPFCAELIQQTANLCKHCRSNLQERSS